MWNCTKGECTLYVIYVTETCVQGEPLKWCSYLLNELFEASEDAYKMVTHFIYGYLVVSIAMMKWCTLEGRDPTKVLDDESLTLAYAP